jgi:hypothetical protein
MIEWMIDDLLMHGLLYFIIVTFTILLYEMKKRKGFKGLYNMATAGLNISFNSLTEVRDVLISARKISPEV